MNLFISVKSELLKTKRTASFYITIIAAVFGPFISLLDVIFDDGIAADKEKIIFNEMMTEKFQVTGLAMFPMFVVLICTLLPQIEYKNNAWKQVLTSAQTKGNVFMAKFINIHLLILVFLVINLLAMFLTVVVLHFMEPSLNILNQPVNGYYIVMLRINSYVDLLAISTIQFWLGLRFKNFIVPIAIGISCWFIGTILVFQFQSGFAAYFHTAFMFSAIFLNIKISSTLFIGSRLDTLLHSLCLVL